MELFKLFGTIAIDNSGANRGIDETTDKAEKSHPKISAAFEKIGSAAVKVGKVMATGLAAGAAAVGALAKQSLDSYAEYEQLAGGAAKIFDEMSQTELLSDAQNAYKDLGLSANQYLAVMNDVGATFAATMGDKAGYEAAKKGLQAISDYASGTGKNVDELSSKFTLITRSTSSYQSIADQFSGILPATSEGFLEQAQAAGILSDSYTKLTEVPIDEYQSAVSQMLEKGVAGLGLTNNTAMEAMTTISGSLAMTKSAWQNLLTGFADGNQDLSVLIDNLVESGTAALGNIVPRIAEILSRVSEALPQIMTVIAAELPGLIESLLPGVIDGAMALLTGLITMLPQILTILIAQLPGIVTQLATAIAQAFPVLLQTVKDLFAQIWDYIAVELLGTEADFESSFGKIKGFFEGLWSELQSIWQSVGQPIWDLIQDCIGIVRDAFAERMPAIKEFVQQCFSDIQEFWNNNLKPCFEAIGDFIENILAPAFEYVFDQVIGPLIDNVFEYIKSLWNNTLKPVFTGITDFLTGVFTGNWKKAWNGIVNVFKGIINIIPTALQYVINGAIALVNGLISGINKISSKIGLGEIKLISKVSLPKLEKGGILEKGQVGLLEGNGAEAVVPLDRNQAWIRAVAQDMKTAGIGGQSDVLVNYMQQLIDMLADFFPQLVEASGHDIVTNDGVIVAHYGPLMNAELGKISARKDRGR